MIRRVRKIPTNIKVDSQVVPATGVGHIASIIQTDTLANLTATHDDLKNPLSINKICPKCMIEMGKGEGVQFEPDWNEIYRDTLTILNIQPAIRCHVECFPTVAMMTTEELIKTQGGLMLQAWNHLRK